MKSVLASLHSTLAIGCVLCVACSSEPQSLSPDGAPDSPPLDGSAPDAMVEPTADAGSTEPALANLGPCESGWSAVERGGVHECDPWPNGRLTCSGAQMQAPGDAACRPVGAACPAGTFPDDLPPTGVIYVDASATAPFLGTVDQPYASLVDAVAAAPAGSTIALARGAYTGSVRIAQELTIRGACAAETILDAGHTGGYLAEDACELLIDLEADLTLQDLSLRSGFGLIAGARGSSLALRGCHLSHSASPIFGVFESIDVIDSLVEVESFPFGADCSASRPFQASAAAGCGTHQSPLPDAPFLPECIDVTMPALELSGMASTQGATPSARIERAEIRGFVLQQQAKAGSLLEITQSFADGAQLVGPSQVRSMVCGDSGLRSLGSMAVDASVCELRVLSGDANVTRHLGPIRMSCSSPSTLTASDLHNQAELDDQPLSLSGNCTASLERVVWDEAIIGVSAEGGAQVEVRDLIVRSPSGSGLAPNWDILPVGVGAYRGASLIIERFEIDTSQGAGAQLGPEANALVLRSGRIANHQIGVNVQIEGYDQALLQQLVIYENNTVDIDAVTLPIPPQLVEWQCGDGVDNDEDGDTDCADSDCIAASGCGAP